MIFVGVCEDNSSDPLKLGRIKVRIIGIHTENKNNEIDNKLLNVDDLPWAVPCFTNSIDGISDFKVPEQGSYVLILFLDSEFQHPIYFGTIPKILQQQPDFTLGFSDPAGKHPNKEYKNESPISRLARNEKIEKTIIQDKKNNVKTGINCNGTSFDEPKTEYDSKYPDNRVIETKSGHIIEIDDTNEKERIHIYHKSGSFQEYFPDGQVVNNIKNKQTTIIISDDNILIEGNKNVHIDGAKNILINKSKNEKINETLNIDVGGDSNITTGGQTNIKSSGKVVITGSKIELN